MASSPYSDVQPLWIRSESPGKRNPEEERLLQLEQDSAASILADGLEVRRVVDGQISKPSLLYILDAKLLAYPGTVCCCFRKLALRHSNPQKSVDVTMLLEVRQGYDTDGLHRAAKKAAFRQQAPPTHCFSIIARHQHSAVKPIDFVAEDAAELETWIAALKLVLTHLEKSHVTFDEKLWLMNQFKKADRDRNGELAFHELWLLLKELNSEMNEVHVRCLFNTVLERHGKTKPQLDPNQFLELFKLLTASPEFADALRHAVGDPDADYMDSRQLTDFLSRHQGFAGVDWQTATELIRKLEVGAERPDKNSPVKMNGQLVLTVNGFRRLLQSRYGSIYKPGHDTVFQDMTRPLSDYYIYSSHNTYLTGLQLSGRAMVEGYINALKVGARLLELDVFDGEDGEPKITHKRTLISAIGLRNAISYIKRYAFEKSPYPVILTLENHCGHEQQGVMAGIFEEILADSLYISGPEDAKRPLPSPQALRFKFLIRGKAGPSLNESFDEEDEPAADEEAGTTPRPKGRNGKDVHPALKRLISLPSVSLKKNSGESVLTEHAANASASLSEGAVEAMFAQTAAPALLCRYTQRHLVKAYPKGMRQDSSNMGPMGAWLSGVQCAAMNVQTEGEEMDLCHGLFAVNGLCGFHLKPALLRDGVDPRAVALAPRMRLTLRVLSGQYLPNADPSADVIDPYVCLQLHGLPADSLRCRTKALRDNGFNPVWNETFNFELRCPEVALLRFVVMDFDSTSADDFVGEFTIPVMSVRTGYSIVRLRTFQRSPDEAASLFVHIDISSVESEPSDLTLSGFNNT